MKQNSSTEKSKNRGFTLVELIVVIAILAILSAVGAVAYTGYIEYTKKGLDKKTVGEIMNAIELANYESPIGYTEIYFTSDGGIQVPVDVGGKVTKALADAFGSEEALAAAKPSYDDWKDQSKTFDLAGIKNILDSITSSGGNLSEMTGLTNYIEAVSGGGAASFSQDIDELWGTVGTFVDLAQSGALAGVPKKDKYIGDVIAYSNRQADSIVDKWGSGDSLIGTDAQIELCVQLAQNYAFVSYAEGHPLLTEEMSEQLKNFATPMKVDAAGNTHLSTIVTTSYKADNVYLTGGNWAAIKSQYVSSGQAKIDALAYCGMMEVANATPDIKNAATDADLLEAFSGYTDELGTILGDPSIIDAVQSSTGDLNVSVSGNGICIKVRKLGDTLSFTVDPPEANPRGNGAGAGTEEVGSCELSHDPFLNVTIGVSGSSLTLTPEKTTVDICTKGGTKTCAIKFSSSVSGMSQALQAVSVSGGDGKVTIERYDSAGTISDSVTWIVTAVEATSEPVSLTLSLSLSGVSADPVTITVNIH